MRHEWVKKSRSSSNTKWITLTGANQWGDHAAFSHFGQPWSAGEFDFDIPVEWEVVGNDPMTNFPHRHQQHKITGSDGTSIVIKLGSSTTRTP